MTKRFYETIVASGGLAGESFDISAGPDNTGVIDVLLSVGDGALTAETPLTLRSTDALGAARQLDLTALEVNNGRMLAISFENTDLATNNVTLVPGTSINGAGSIAVSEVSQWVLFHLNGGVWFALRQWPQNTVEGAAVRRLAFVVGAWAAGVANEVTITQSAGPGAGQIGPHSLDVASNYVVMVYDTDGANPELVTVDVEVDAATGNITLAIAGPGLAFGGEVIIVGDL